MVAVGVTVLAAVVLVPVGPAVAIALSDAPGAPGAAATWTTVTRKVWVLHHRGVRLVRLTGGTLSECTFRRGNTSNVRELQFAVTDAPRSRSGDRRCTTRTVALVDQKC
jgi:hypothetical protein